MFCNKSYILSVLHDFSDSQIFYETKSKAVVISDKIWLLWMVQWEDWGRGAHGIFQGIISVSACLIFD